jgi:expansin (peptidoglycan-binding protein)
MERENPLATTDGEQVLLDPAQIQNQVTFLNQVDVNLV